MDKPIAVGDLAMHVRVCCKRSDAVSDLGKIAIIKMVRVRETRCQKCGQLNQGVHASAKTNGIGVPVEWLKRIEPPALPESIEHKESLTA